MFQWKAHGQCSKGDSCSFSLASGNKGKGKRRKERSSSPAFHSKVTAKEQESSQRSGIKQENLIDHSEIPCGFKFCKNPSCGFWHPPVWLNYKSEKVVFLATHAISDMLRQKESPTRSRSKVVQKDQLFFFESESFQLGYVSQDFYPRNFIPREEGMLGSKHTVKFSKRTWHQIKIRERRGLSLGIIQKLYASWAYSLCAEIRRKITWGILDPRRMRPQSSVGLGEDIYKPENSGQSYVLYSWWSQRYVDTCHFKETSKEREFVVYSGASMHMMSKKELSSGEMGHGGKLQSPYSSVDCKRRSAHPRGGTSVRSWLESGRYRATTRRSARCPVARQALQSPRILLWVGQRSRAHDWPRMGQLLICKADSVVPSLLSFQGYLSTLEAVRLLQPPPQESLGPGVTSSLYKQGCSKLTFRHNIRGKWRTRLQETGAGIPWEATRTRTIRWQTCHSGWRISQIIWFFTEVHAPAPHFSGLRF